MALIVGLPTITISTGVAPQSAIWTNDVIDDAEMIAFTLNATTTAPSIQLQGTLSTSTSATFINILMPIDSTNPSAMVVSSSGVYVMWAPVYRQIKFNSTGLVTAAGGIPISGTKRIAV